MIESVNVIGARGRVGGAVSARLAERGITLCPDGAGLVLLCVPDRAIADVAATIEPGPCERPHEMNQDQDSLAAIAVADDRRDGRDERARHHGRT